MQDRKQKDQVNEEVAVLVRVIAPDDPIEFDPLDELQGLAETAGALVMGGLSQRLEKPNPATYLGKGKVEELAQLVEFHAADVVLFDNNLSPAQNRNLEEALKVKVLDRTELILDIFATHAQTYEARLAVELAQLQYALPRLKRMWTHLSRMKMGVGMRGPGEKQLETDRRLVEKRIHDLKQELKKVENRKERQVGSRRGTMTVSLVGYTNAGKSTLFNRLTDERVYAADQLFATLDPTLRRLELPGGGAAVLADTVGFIRDLPHELVDAFRSTLTETLEADLLLHVVDDADEDREARRADVADVLEGIGAAEVPELLVFNKIDLTGHSARIERSESGEPQAVYVSAARNEGVAELLEAIAERLSEGRRSGWLRLGPERGRLRAQLFEARAVVEERVESDGASLVHLDMEAVDFARLDREHRISDDLVFDEPPDAAVVRS